MNDVVATIIRNDIDILDEIAELENSVAGDEALDAGQTGPGDQISESAAVRKLLSAHFICDACKFLLTRRTSHYNV